MSIRGGKERGEGEREKTNRKRWRVVLRDKQEEVPEFGVSGRRNLGANFC